MPKLSPWSLCKETYALLWRHKFTWLGLTAAFFVSGFVIAGGVGLLAAKMHPTQLVAGVVVAGIGVVVIAIMLVTHTIGLHFGITASRGAPKLLPEALLPRVWRVFLRMLLYLVCMLGGELACFLPFSLARAGVAWFFPGNKAAELVVLVTSVIAIGIILSSLMIRLGCMVPGAAVGEKVTLKGSFAMTRGYTVRLLLGAVLIFLPLLVVQCISTLSMVAMEVGETVNSLVTMVLGIAQTPFMLAAVSVMYARLTDQPATPGAEVRDDTFELEASGEKVGGEISTAE